MAAQINGKPFFYDPNALSIFVFMIFSGSLTAIIGVYMALKHFKEGKIYVPRSIAYGDPWAYRYKEPRVYWGSFVISLIILPILGISLVGISFWMFF